MYHLLKKKTVLHLKCRDAIFNLKQLSNNLFMTNGIMCHLDDSLPISLAMTELDSETAYVSHVNIGVKDIVNCKFRKVSDEAFARVVLNMYHEYTHCQQKNNMFKSLFLSGNDKNQFVQEIACRNNMDYYRNSGLNYYYNANEIQAEYSGIIGAYHYLCNMFPNIESKQLEQVVLNVVNENVSKYTYYIDTTRSYKYDSLDDVKAAFEIAYDSSFDKPRMYKITNHDSKDEAVDFILQHKDAYNVYFDLKTAIEKDEFIAAISCKLHPEYLQQYPVLQNMKLSYEDIIEKHSNCIGNKQIMCGSLDKESLIHVEQERLFGQVKNRNVSVEHDLPAREHVSHLSRAEQTEAKFGNLFENEIQKQEDTQFT